MNLDRAARLAVAGLFGLTLVALPALAHAQVGSLAGKVVGPDGKPVRGCRSDADQRGE